MTIHPLASPTWKAYSQQDLRQLSNCGRNLKEWKTRSSGTFVITADWNASRENWEETPDA